MPTKLNLPNIDDLLLIEQIVAERTREPNKTYFATYKQTWKSRISEYMAKQGNPEIIDNSLIDEPNKDKFINLYTNHKKTITTGIINILKQHTLLACPFCGESGTPATLDHFLPKEKYPEYSILSTNLVPMCDICQKADAKGSKVLDANSKRLFIHPYYDPIENMEIFILNIEEPYDTGANFQLIVNPNIEEPFSAVCKNHLKELCIQARYRVYFSQSYIRLKKNIKQFKRNRPLVNLEDIIDIFLTNATSVAINNWDTIFYRAVARNDGLMAYLKTINDEDYE